jgi:hypothetical protein
MNIHAYQIALPLLITFFAVVLWRSIKCGKISLSIGARAERTTQPIMFWLMWTWVLTLELLVIYLFISEVSKLL